MLAVDSVERQLKIVLVDIEGKEPGGTQPVKSLNTHCKCFFYFDVAVSH